MPYLPLFPLVDVNGERSPHLDAVLRELPSAEMVRVDYEFQRGGNEMLRIRTDEIER